MENTTRIPVATYTAAHHEAVLRQAEALLQGEPDLIARMANMAALIHQAFGSHWVGFYRTSGNELVLGPFQGPVACTRIPWGKGVCGTAWAEGRTLVVPDVDLFPGHIACSPASRSELVVPVRDAHGQIIAVLDIDSVRPNEFGAADAMAFERWCALLTSTA